jgi:hypothetical protein
MARMVSLMIRMPFSKASQQLSIVDYIVAPFSQLKLSTRRYTERVFVFISPVTPTYFLKAIIEP